MSVALTPSSTFISPNDPCFNEPQTESAAPQRWRECRKFARKQRQCIGCGKKIKASRIRCHNPYMCDNCGSGRTLAWVWLKKRDPEVLGSVEHTGVELSMPLDPSLSLIDNERRLLTFRERLTDELAASEVYMPRITPAASTCRVRVSLDRRIRRDQLAAAWCRITNGHGEVTEVKHYQKGDCLREFFGWILSGMHWLTTMTEADRLSVWQEFKGSHRISARGGFYAPLPADELAALIAAHKAFNGSDLCDCCGSPMQEVAKEDQETMLVDDFIAAHSDCYIDWTEDYDPFHQARVKGLYGTTINLLPITTPMPAVSPPI